MEQFQDNHEHADTFNHAKVIEIKRQISQGAYATNAKPAAKKMIEESKYLLGDSNV